MIQDGINYGIGYCKATEPGPDVESACLKDGQYSWCNRMLPLDPLMYGHNYRQPIKLQLQAGESYYMRNCEVVDDLLHVPGNHQYQFCNKEYTMSWADNGRYNFTYATYARDLVEHIPKQKETKMNEKYLKVKNAKNIYYAEKTLHLEVPISEAERLGEEAKRMREENKIKAGDFVMRNDNIYKVVRIDVASENLLIVTGGYFQCVTDCTKITNPAHIKALTEIYEAMK